MQSEMLSYNYTYFKIVPTGFFLAALNSSNSLTIGLSDSLLFMPVYYSYDLDKLTDPSLLDYNFYCILINKNQSMNNFNQNLYSIKPNVDLTNDQIQSYETCFKSKGFKIYLLL
jgi:hypothetical protein